MAHPEPISLNTFLRQFEGSSSVVYGLDSSFRIIYCNAAWDKFAASNGGGVLQRERVIGTDVLAITTADLRPFYLQAFRVVIESQRPWEHDYECSSAELHRLYHMRVLPLPGSRLLIESSRVVERPHDPNRLRMPPIETIYRDPYGVIVMCANCRRTKRLLQGTPAWDWVPDFVNERPQRTVHGLCENCAAYY